MSRADTLYASAYDTEHTHELRIRRHGERTFTVEMQGALPGGAVIDSVTWHSPHLCHAEITPLATSETSFTAKLVGVTRGRGYAEARITLTNGDVSIQRIHVWVQ